MNFVQVQTSYTPEVALESIVSNVDKSFSSMVSSIAQYIPDLRNMLVSPIEQLSRLKELPSGLLSSLSSTFGASTFTLDEFRSFDKVKVTVPESFSGNLSEYSAYLNSSWNFLNQRALPQIDLFYGFLASFASNKEAKISLTDTTKIYKALQEEHTSLKKEGSSYFGNVRHNSSSSTLGVCFSDFEQYRKTQDTARSLCKDLSTKQASQVCDKIKKISSVLEVIIEDAKARNYDKASYEAVKSLAVGIYALAEVLEFYSVTYYRTIELGSVMATNKAVINKMK